jgi:hypothetical protein
MYSAQRMIKETPSTRYRVLVNGQTLHESPTMQLAESFILSLLPEQRMNASIIPISDDGKQVLLG